MDLEEEKEELYLKVFTLSLILHISIFWGLNQLSKKKNSSKPTEDRIEVTYDEKEKIFVPNLFSPALVPPTEKDKEKFTPFFSRFFHRTKEEFVAAQRGAINFNSPLPGFSNPNKAPSLQSLRKSGEISDFQLSLPNNIPGSRVNLYLPHLKKAYITVLNTNAYNNRKFYIFFERIFEQVVLRWISNVDLMSKLLSYKKVDQLKKKHDVVFTKLDLLFDKKGYLKETKVVQSSGIKELDYAAIDAFEDAAPFLNPPQELINKKDGFRLGFGFAYTFNER